MHSLRRKSLHNPSAEIEKPAEIKAALLIAHGSRREEANAELSAVAEAIRQHNIVPIVETAYLEIASPDIPQGARRCVEAGATHVFLLPYFLSAGAHVVEDLQRHCEELAARFPDRRWTLCPPLGGHPLLIEIVLDRLHASGAVAE